MQPEKSVQVEHRVARYIDGWTHCVIRRFAVRHNDVQTVSSSSLKDNNQTLVPVAGRFRAIYGPRQKAWQGSCADDRESPITQKYATCDHKNSRTSLFPALSLHRFSPTAEIPTAES